MDVRVDGYLSITRLQDNVTTHNVHCAEQQLSCHAAAASRMARWPSWHTVPQS